MAATKSKQRLSLAEIENFNTNTDVPIPSDQDRYTSSDGPSQANTDGLHMTQSVKRTS